jgi:hypothetical protein
LNTIKEAHEYLNTHVAKGVKCPCCGQFVKLYKRRIVSSAALGLIKLVRMWQTNPDWYHVIDLDVTSSGGEFARLRRFGLIVQKQNTDKTKTNSGYWKPTEKGINFVFKKIKVPKYFLMFNGTGFGFSEEEIDIQQALGKKFNYQELMK